MAKIREKVVLLDVCSINTPPVSSRGSPCGCPRLGRHEACPYWLVQDIRNEHLGTVEAPGYGKKKWQYEEVEKAMASESDDNGTSKMKRKAYEKELERLQAELCMLQDWVKYKGLRVIIVFEGRDAA